MMFHSIVKMREHGLDKFGQMLLAFVSTVLRGWPRYHVLVTRFLWKLTVSESDLLRLRCFYPDKNRIS